MKKLTLLMMLVMGMTMFVACSDDDDSPALNQMTVQLTSSKADVSWTDFTVTVTEARSGEVYSAKPNTTGAATFSLPYGQYSVVAQDSVNGGATLYGSATTFTFSETASTCTVQLQDIMNTLDHTFVLNELGFNCTSNGDYDNNMYEEYFTITNISDRPLYADGLSFAICADYNAIEDDGTKSAYLDRDSIVVSQLYTIPGNGREHLVQPGASLVIAHSAINHITETKDYSGNPKEAPNALDLSGADFEIYVPYEYSMTTDNPEVPNLTVNYSWFQAFSWGYTGYAPLMIVRADTDLDTYVPAHLRNLSMSGGWGNRKADYLVIPQSWIIDGVETGNSDTFYHKVLPVTVDKSSILIEDAGGMYGGFGGYLVQRKPATTGYLQDTNDSQNDFVVVPNGLKSYPKK